MFLMCDLFLPALQLLNKRWIFIILFGSLWIVVFLGIACLHRLHTAI